MVRFSVFLNLQTVKTLGSVELQTFMVHGCCQEKDNKKPHGIILLWQLCGEGLTPPPLSAHGDCSPIVVGTARESGAGVRRGSGPNQWWKERG